MSNFCTEWVCLCFQEESGATDDSAQERFIGPLPREGSMGCTNDYVSQSYSYSSVLSKSETGTVFSLVKAMLICNYFSSFSNSSTSGFFFNKLQFILKIPTSLLHFLSCFLWYSHITLEMEELYSILSLLWTFFWFNITEKMIYIV